MLEGLLAPMRETVVRTLDQTIDVQNRVRVRTVTGGSAYSFLGGVPVPGRFMATGHREMDFAAKIGIVATHVAILPYDTSVQVDDRLVVEGIGYAVTGVMAHGIPVLIKVLCARVES